MEEVDENLPRNSSIKREMHDLEISLIANEVVKFKNEYMNKIMKHERNMDSKFIDFEALDAIYVSNKKLSFVRDFFLVRLASKFIYKQHNVKSRMGYLPGLIFFLLMIEMVRLPSSYNKESHSDLIYDRSNPKTRSL